MAARRLLVRVFGQPDAALRGRFPPNTNPAASSSQPRAGGHLTGTDRADGGIDAHCAAAARAGRRWTRRGVVPHLVSNAGSRASPPAHKTLQTTVQPRSYAMIRGAVATVLAALVFTSACART